MGVQKKKLLHRIMALAIAVAVGLSVIVPGGTSAEAATIPADVTKPSANCVFIAMKGKYVSEASAAVKRINQIRYEACKQGVKIDGRKLTLDDYVPIKWSAGLEKIARIRAAEASVTMYHSRLNGKSVFDFKYPGNGWPTSEVLAWNWSESMLMGIEQWYSEKDDYVKGTPGAVTGHYTSMIKPANRYVGVGTFINKNASYPNTTAAQFMGSGSQAETMAKSTGESDVTVEVQKDNITSVKMTGNKSVQEGQKITLTLKAVLGQYGSTSYKVLAGAKWTTSNSAIAKVSSTGVVTGLRKGSVKITATVGSRSASYTVTVTGKCAHVYSGKVVKTATTRSDGKVLHTCRKCGQKKYIVVKKIKSVTLSQTRYKYDGKTKTPKVTVKDSDGKIISSKYYKVTYPKARKKTGTYTVKIKFSGRYKGTVSKKYRIVK